MARTIVEWGGFLQQVAGATGVAAALQQVALRLAG